MYITSVHMDLLTYGSSGLMREKVPACPHGIGVKLQHCHVLPEGYQIIAPGTGDNLLAGYQPNRSATSFRESGRACCTTPLVINRLSRTIQSDHKDAKQ